MNKVTSNNSMKTKALGFFFAALAPAAFADHGYDYDAHARRERGADVSGTVAITKEIPGGVITVGATIGRPAPVVVHEKVVVVRQEERCEPKQVVIVKEQPRKVVIVKESPHKKVVIVKKIGRDGRVYEKKVITKGKHRHGRHGRQDWDDDRDGWRDRDHGRGHAHQVSIQERGHGGNYHYYEDANQVSIQEQNADGNYHYYEDANQVSVQDNRGGQNRHVYVRK